MVEIMFLVIPLIVVDIWSESETPTVQNVMNMSEFKEVYELLEKKYGTDPIVQEALINSMVAGAQRQRLTNRILISIVIFCGLLGYWGHRQQLLDSHQTE
tara:strand:- start:1030 stop:1329 length:300 start_codon:yes stop_codon:yes gene_type:complete